MKRKKRLKQKPVKAPPVAGGGPLEQLTEPIHSKIISRLVQRELNKAMVDALRAVDDSDGEWQKDEAKLTEEMVDLWVFGGFEPEGHADRKKAKLREPKSMPRLLSAKQDLNPLEKLGKYISSLSSNMLLNFKMRFFPTDRSRYDEARRNLRKHRAKVLACDVLIRQCTARERALRAEALKLSIEAQKLARRAVRKKQKDYKLVEASEEMAKRARKALDEANDYSKLQETRLTMLKRKQAELEMSTAGLEQILHSCKMKLDKSNLQSVSTRLDQCKAKIEDFEIKQMEKRVVQNEAYANSMKVPEYRPNRRLLKNLGLLEDQVAAMETSAKESRDALAKMSPVDIETLNAAERQSALKELEQAMVLLRRAQVELIAADKMNRNQMENLQEQIAHNHDAVGESAQKRSKAARELFSQLEERKSEIEKEKVFMQEEFERLKLVLDELTRLEAESSSAVVK